MLETDIQRPSRVRTNSIEEPKVENKQDFKFSRHDHHNIELKSSLELTASAAHGEVEMYLFFPRSLQANTWGKNKMRSDFNSRMRLSIPKEQSSESAEIESALMNLTKNLRRYWSEESTDESVGRQSFDEIFRSCRHLGAIFGEHIRGRKSLQRKQLFLAHSLVSGFLEPKKALSDLAREIEAVARAVSSVRKIIDQPGVLNIPIVDLLDNYIYNLYVDYLASMKVDLAQVIQNSADKFETEKSCQAIGVILSKLQKDESQRNLKLGRTADFENDQASREIHLLKLGQMKKFFQSEMFIDVHQKETIKKLTEPLAVGGALVAASLAAFLEQMSHRNWVGVAGFGGLMVGVAGVALYVFKDRMKDQARTFFTAKLGRILPDLEREIRTDGQVIGSVREWFGYKKVTDTPDSVKQYRSRACVSEAEKFLPEDIFYFRRQFEIRNSESCGLKVKRSLQENLRINVHRHLKHMDDVTKSFRVLDADGQFSNLESHRVYHIHAVLLSSLKNTVKSKNPIKKVASRTAHHEHIPDHMEVYRIVLDKNGVDRVEPLF